MAVSTTTALIISGVTAAAQAAASYAQSKSAADAQEEYNKQLEKQAIESYSELDKQEADAIEASHKESLQAQREYMKARSTIELQAAATGTYGQSIDVAIEDLNTGLGQRMADITSRREMQLDNIDTQAKNIRNQAKGSSDYTIQPPAFYSAGLSGLSTFSQVYGMTSAVSTSSAEGAAANQWDSSTFAGRQRISAGNYDW
jgi:flagellar biosynthesis component FlhA